MRKLTEILCILIVCVMLFSTTALAVEVNTPRASSYFVTTSAKIKETSSGLEIWFDTTGTGIMDQIGAKTVVLYRSADGSSWTSIKTFTKEAYPEMIRKDAGAHSCCLTYSASKGYYYKAYVTFYAKKGTGTGEVTQYSSSLKL